MKINSLQIENVKRVKAVRLEPAKNGLTVIGGANGQGKTSVLDAIAWALGGDRYRPAQARRAGSVLAPRIHIVMDNGLVVERKGKNSDLTVTDPEGKRAGQQLLNSFVEQLALDLPRFMQQTAREKGDTLLRVIGVGDRLKELERKEKETYNQRHAIGQIADQKKKFAREQPYYPDAPDEPVSAGELIRQQQEILARNGENARKRARLKEIMLEKQRLLNEMDGINDQLERLTQRKDAVVKAYEQAVSDEQTAVKNVETLRDESTEALENNIREIDEINRKVRANLDKQKAEDDANEFARQYDTLSHELDGLRSQKAELLHQADLPLPDLTVEDGELRYRGFTWDSMSGAEQLKVATAIVRKLNPNCGFVLLDKLEQMDINTLRDFGTWLEKEGLQAIATRVSTGGDGSCTIIIEDGAVMEGTPSAREHEGQPEGLPQARNADNREGGPQAVTWKAGEF